MALQLVVLACHISCNIRAQRGFISDSVYNRAQRGFISDSVYNRAQRGFISVAPIKTILPYATFVYFYSFEVFHYKT